MNIISAKEALELSFPDRVEEVLSQLDSLIRKAAARGETDIRIPYELCRVNGYSIELRSKKVEKALLDAGYRLAAKSEDRQFVDVWFELSWSE